jgi:hypothetical protein
MNFFAKNKNLKEHIENNKTILNALQEKFETLVTKSLDKKTLEEKYKLIKEFLSDTEFTNFIAQNTNNYTPRNLALTYIGEGNDKNIA